MTAPRNTVLRGDCRELMRSLPADSVDAIVTDPPYELGFMGKSWDSAGVSYDPATWAEALRVLKPGGHLLAFGGSRTYHRIAVAIEDAGFEIRDSLMWIYGSGFPKSLDVSKAIDKKAGAEREITRIGTRHSTQEFDTASSSERERRDAPATDEAKRWEGWGTALKPSHEPIVLARKPLVGTVAENVLAHGTGALNIDASRIGRAEGDVSVAGQRTATFGTQETISGGDGSGGWSQSDAGRWPANVLFDEEAAALLDAQSGHSKSSDNKWEGENNAPIYGKYAKGVRQATYSDSGGASRFFYVAKAGKKERNAGLDGFVEKRPDERTEKGMGTFDEKGVAKQSNFHPTVKPITLMRYLVRLITPPGGVVLDPFLGSGTTACAAVLEGFDWLGMEMTPEYADIAEARVKHWQKEAQNG